MAAQLSLACTAARVLPSRPGALLGPRRAAARVQAIAAHPNGTSASPRPRLAFKRDPAAPAPAPAPEPHPDRRHGDPERGGLSSGQKAAVSREFHGTGHANFVEDHPEMAPAAEQYRHELEERHAHQLHADDLNTGEKAAVTRSLHHTAEVHFTADHPEKAKAAEEYKHQVEAREEQAAPSAASKAATTAGKAAATGSKAAAAAPAEGKAKKKTGRPKGSTKAKADPLIGELSTGEKSALSRAVKQGRNIDELPFIKSLSGKLANARAFAREVRLVPSATKAAKKEAKKDVKKKDA